MKTWRMSLSDADMNLLLYKGYFWNDKTVIFDDDDGRPALKLTFSSGEEAIAFLAHAESENFRWSSE